MKVRRFFYVRAPLGRVMHISYSHRRVEGDRTACGLRMLKGWVWASAMRKGTGAKVARCRRCQAVETVVTDMAVQAKLVRRFTSI